MLQKYHEKNRDLIVNINGRLVHRDQAGVSPFDSSVQGGDAVWEGLRLYDGRLFRLAAHLSRLRRSAQALAFTQIPTDRQIVDEIRRTLDANQMHDGVHIRLTLTRGVKYTSGMDPRLNTAGPTLIVLAEHKPPVYDKGGVRLITSGIRRFSADGLDPKIHHNNLLQSILAKIQANQAGADDALMLDQRGFVAETNATHVFLVRHERRRNIDAGQAARSLSAAPPPSQRDLSRVEIFTPFCHACPEGITRAAVLEICRRESLDCREAELSLTDVYTADEMFCTGTMGELTPVLEVDGRIIGTGAAGWVVSHLSGSFRKLVEAESEPLAV